MAEVTTCIDPMGHAYVIDGPVAYVSVYGTVITMTPAEARQAWATSAREARSYTRPVDLEAGRRALHGW